MSHSRFFKNILKGSVGAVILYIGLLVILSIVMTIFDVSETVYNIVYTIISLLALSIGAIVTAKGNESKGWLSGILVGVVFCILSSLFAVFFTDKPFFSIMTSFKFISCIIIGFVAGILGINM